MFSFGIVRQRRLGRIRFAAVALALAASVAATPHSAPSTTSANDFVVLVNAANPVASLEREDVSKMFFKKVAKWPDGAAVEPLDLAPTARSRISFTETVHRKSVGAVRAFWQQQIFSGRNVPPPEKGSDAEVIAFVREHRGAVGYVSASAQLRDGVRTLDVRGLAR
jgi:ABC-type phosphate transport system substrate-binding protein